MIWKNHLLATFSESVPSSGELYPLVTILFAKQLGLTYPHAVAVARRARQFRANVERRTLLTYCDVRAHRGAGVGGLCAAESHREPQVLRRIRRRGAAGAERVEGSASPGLVSQGDFLDRSRRLPPPSAQGPLAKPGCIHRGIPTRLPVRWLATAVSPDQPIALGRQRAPSGECHEPDPGGRQKRLALAPEFSGGSVPASGGG